MILQLKISIKSILLLHELLNKKITYTGKHREKKAECVGWKGPKLAATMREILKNHINELPL